MGDAIRVAFLADSRAYFDSIHPFDHDSDVPFHRVAQRDLEALGHEVDLRPWGGPLASFRSAIAALRIDFGLRENIAKADVIVLQLGDADCMCWMGGVFAGGRNALPSKGRAGRGRRTMWWFVYLLTLLTQGRIPFTIQRRFGLYWKQLLHGIRRINPEAVIITLDLTSLVRTPRSHQAQFPFPVSAFARMDPRLDKQRPRHRQLAEQLGVFYVETNDIVLAADRENTDGLHWTAEIHKAAGHRLGAAIVEHLGADDLSERD